MKTLKTCIIASIIAIVVELVGYVIRKGNEVIDEAESVGERRKTYMMDRLEEAVEGAKAASKMAYAAADDSRGLANTLRNLIGAVAEPTPTQAPTGPEATG